MRCYRIWHAQIQLADFLKRQQNLTEGLGSLARQILVQFRLCHSRSLWLCTAELACVSLQGCTKIQGYVVKCPASTWCREGSHMFKLLLPVEAPHSLLLLFHILPYLACGQLYQWTCQGAEDRTPCLPEPETESKFLFVVEESSRWDSAWHCGSPLILSPPHPGSDSPSATSLLWDFRQISLSLPTSVFSSTKQYLLYRVVVKIKWRDTFECSGLCSKRK